MKRRLKKKGMMEEQFNWIFILIIGAVIILFFVKVVYNQKTISERKLAAKVLNELNLLSVGAEVATSTSSRIGISGNPIAFECSEECKCEYYMKDFGNTYTVSYNSRALFAPSVVTADQDAIAWALDWNMPYKVTNFLYVTSPDVLYVFLDEGVSQTPDYLQQIVNDLPDDIDNGKKGDMIYDVNSANVPYANEYEVRIVAYNFADIHDISKVIDGPTGSLKDVDYRKISVLEVSLPQGSSDYGTLRFYNVAPDRSLIQKPDASTSTYYAGEASLIGAILTDNYYNYVCPMEAGFMRLNHVNDIYMTRNGYLEGRYYNAATPDKCYLTYHDAETPLSTIRSNSDGYFSESTGWDGKIGLIYQSSFGLTSLSSQNEKALLFSCPEIF